MKIHCLYDSLAPVADLKPHPKNRNKHPDEQIKRLAEILKFQGFRYPVKVSKRSGFITSGHGRVLAAKLNGWAQVPVNYQDYESDEQEYADVQADNAIASWADLDLDGIKDDLIDLPDLGIEMLGIEGFTLNAPVETTEYPELSDGDRSPLRTMSFTLHVDQIAEVERAMTTAKGIGAFVDTGNENANGNCLARVCEMFNAQC